MRGPFHEKQARPRGCRWPSGQAPGAHPVCLGPDQQQHLIELIRQRETEAALEFAQTQLAEQGEESRECLTEMERTLALLAFDNPEDSPFGDLLNMMQRQKVGARRVGGFRLRPPQMFTGFPKKRGGGWVVSNGTAFLAGTLLGGPQLFPS